MSGRTWCAIGFVLFRVLAAQGAPVGLDAFGYEASSSVSYSFVDITAAGVRVLGNDDDAAVTANIGFDFKFFGSNYTTAGISSNGLITFGGTNSFPVPVDLTTSALSIDLPTIAVWWDDWSTLKNPFSDSDAVYYATLGSPGSREFVVQWNNVYACCPWGTSPVTFEAILFEGSNNIVFQYAGATSGVTDGVVGDANDQGGTGAIGIRDKQAEWNGRSLQISFAKAVLLDKEAILFSTSDVPEPSTWLPMALGLGGVGVLLKWRG